MICKTLAELREFCSRARADGGEVPVLTLDNDDTYAYLGEECVFGGTHPHQLLEQALDLLGILHEEP